MEPENRQTDSHVLPCRSRVRVVRFVHITDTLIVCLYRHVQDTNC
jgi:hypothetical protein